MMLTNESSNNESSNINNNHNKRKKRTVIHLFRDELESSFPRKYVDADDWNIVFRFVEFWNNIDGNGNGNGKKEDEILSRDLL
jgi:hypothetical protein